MKSSQTNERRIFLKKLCKFCSCYFLMSGFLPAIHLFGSPLSRIVVVQENALFHGDNLKFPAVRQLLRRGLELYFGAKAEEGLRSIIHPGMTVGLKVNCLSGHHMSTSVPLVRALVELLLKIGIKGKRILIWDRFQRDLQRGGFEKSAVAADVLILGNDKLGLSSQLTVHRSIASLFSRALNRCDVIINLPVLKDHGIAGVTISLKNFFGAIHNPNKYHFSWNPAIADLYSYPLIRKKTVLTIVDALEAQYEGGPPYQPQWTWRPGMLLIGQDPVALDYYGWQIIEQKRAEKGLPSLKEDQREPTYIFTAESYQLGTTSYQQMEILKD